MQRRVELMHAHWADKAFIKRPSKLKHKAELERVLLVEPPAGVPAVGWVPVSISEIYEDSAGTGPGLDAGFAVGGY